jgi:hypothetical protein
MAERSTRLDQAEVPGGFRRSLTKPKIALEEIGRLMAFGVRFHIILADATSRPGAYRADRPRVPFLPTTASDNIR